MKIKIKNLLCAPLRIRKNIIGVINLSKSSDKLFELNDLKLLHSMAINASIAIENGRSFSKLKDATNEFLRHATMLDMN